MQNIFENPAFSMSALTAAINILPNNYDRLAQMGLFVDRPQRFRSIIVEKQNNVLTLLPTMIHGARRCCSHATSFVCGASRRCWAGCAWPVATSG